MNKRVLITGGAGFVGKYFCKRFLSLGYDVLCIDNLMSESAKHPDAWPEHLACAGSDAFSFLQADCRSHFRDDKTFADYYDVIIHLAAVVGGRAHMESSPLEVSEDLSIDAAFFNWLTKLTQKPGKVVYFSSSAVYPISLQTFDKHIELYEDLLNFTHDSIGVPDVTYGWAKMTGEYLASVAHEKYGINIVCYRPFSGYAETQNEVYPFIGILTRVLRHEDPVEIWSDSVRDFVYIEDVVDCVLHTMTHVSDGSALNIGSGRAVSFSELAKLMMEQVGYEGSVKVLDDKPKGVFYRVANVDELDKYNWKPTVSLESGIARAIKFLQQ